MKTNSVQEIRPLEHVRTVGELRELVAMLGDVDARDNICVQVSMRGHIKQVKVYTYADLLS